MHFSAALLLSAIVRIPWESTAPVAMLWGLVGVSGVGYSLVVARRMRSQTSYRPDPDDWVYYMAIPLAAYVLLMASGSTLYQMAVPRKTRGVTRRP